MLQYLVFGLFAGAIYALSSVGIVLTYKTTGVFNFAYGGVAMFCAFVFWQLRDQWGLNQWFSIPLLVFVVAPVLGLILEALFRTLTANSVDVQIVCALGALAFFEAVVPIIWTQLKNEPDHPLPTVFSEGQFTIGGATVTGNEAGTFVLALVLGIGLWAALRWTPLGMATRAVVDNRDLASLVAVNPVRITQSAWVISTVFAAVAGVLLSTANDLVTYVLPFLVIYSFAPAVLGRLTNLPVAFGGSVVLGLIINILSKYNSSGFVAKLEGSIPYLALFLLLVVYGRRLTEVRAAAKPMTGSRTINAPTRDLGVGAIGLIIAFGVFPHVFSGSTISDLGQAMAYAVVALTVVMLTGWTGQISLGQMSFAGVGAFTAAHIAGTHGGLFPLAIVVGIAIAVPTSLLIGLPSLRLSGLFLALATMAFALLMDNLVFSDSSISGGSTGLNLTSAKIGPISIDSPTSIYYLCAVVLSIAAFGLWWLRRGPIGRRLQMVRDSPEAASTLGASLTVTKLAVFAGGAALASVAGALLAVTQGTVVPSQFSFDTSLELLLVVVLGGRSYILGALVAGGFDLMQLLPLPSWVHTYLPLGIALAVISIAREPEGLPRVMLAQARESAAVLRSRALRFAAHEPPAAVASGAGPGG
jgi:branched-chain amino acid transport system permease protein